LQHRSTPVQKAQKLDLGSNPIPEAWDGVKQSEKNAAIILHEMIHQETCWESFPDGLREWCWLALGEDNLTELYSEVHAIVESCIPVR